MSLLHPTYRRWHTSKGRREIMGMMDQQSARALYRSTGISYQTILNIRSGKTQSPTLEILDKLFAVVDQRTNGE